MRSVIVGDCLESVFRKLIAVEVIGIESEDLVNCSVERDAGAESGENIADGFSVLMRYSIVIDNECWVVIESRLGEYLLSVWVIVSSMFTAL